MAQPIKLYRIVTDFNGAKPAAVVAEIVAEETAKLYRFRWQRGGWEQIEKAYAANQGYHLTPEAAVTAWVENHENAVRRHREALELARKGLEEAHVFALSDWQASIRLAE